MAVFGFATGNFATVQQAVFYLLGVLMDWLTILIVIALVYMLFMLVTDGKGLEGLKDLFKKKDGDHDDHDSKDKKHGKTGKEGEEEGGDGDKKGKKGKKPTYTYLDPSKVAEVKVGVADEQGRGISRAQVTFAPNRQRIEMGADAKEDAPKAEEAHK